MPLSTKIIFGVAIARVVAFADQVEESRDAAGVLAEHQLGEGALADLPSTGYDDDPGVVEGISDELGRSSGR